MSTRNRDIFTRLVRTRPLMTAALAYLLGCIMGYAVDIPVWIWAVCTGIIFMPLLFSKRRRIMIPLMIIIAMLPFGAMRFDLAWNSVPVVESKNPVELTGRIVSVPEYREDTERTICELDDITIDGEAVNYKLRLYLRGDTALLKEVRIAEIVSCRAHLWQADAASNPGQFSFQDYLRLNGLSGYATAKIEDASFAQARYTFGERIALLKHRLGNYIERLFPENPAIARAFLIGDRTHLSEYDRENFSKSGVAHLLAISGMYISVLAAMVSMLISRFTSRKTAFFATLSVLVVYGFIIGFTPSFTRALILFTLYSGAPVAGRNYDAPTSLGASMLAYLMIRPVGILESGFVLSFGAAAGIIFVLPPLRALTHTDALLARRPRHGFKALLTDRLPKWIVSSVLISLAAQIAIFPVVINNFGYQSPWTLIANLICVPLAMAAYIASIIGALIGLPFVACAGDKLFSALRAITEFFAALPFSEKYLPHFPLWICAAYALCLFLSSDLTRIPMKIRRFLPLMLIPAVIGTSLIAAGRLDGCSIIFFDAGQADCAAIQCEGKFYLIDTGDDYTPAADYMRLYAIKPEAIFLSHGHEDHAGGLNDILDYCPPKTIYLSSSWNEDEYSETITAAVSRAKEIGCNIIPVSAGDEIHLSDESFLRVLAPEAGFSANSANDDSLILKIECGGVSALFTGDASADAIAAVAEDVDILKVAHHGSREHTSSELIAKTTPSVAFVPVGYNNFGHPSDKVIRMLESAGTKVYRGDQYGAVICEIEKDGSISVRCHKDPEAVNGVE